MMYKRDLFFSTLILSFHNKFFSKSNWFTHCFSRYLFELSIHWFFAPLVSLIPFLHLNPSHKYKFSQNPYSPWNSLQTLQSGFLFIVCTIQVSLTIFQRYSWFYVHVYTSYLFNEILEGRNFLCPCDAKQHSFILRIPVMKKTFLEKGTGERMQKWAL